MNIKPIITVTITILLLSSLSIAASFNLERVLAQTSTPTIWITIYRIQAVDSIEGFLEGGADWHFYIWVWSGNAWLSVDDTAPGDQSDVIVDKIYTFNVGTVSSQIEIALLDDDFWTAADVADISGYPGGGYDNYDGTLPRGAKYVGTYDLRTNVVTGDEIITEGSYFKTSGDYDNSVGVDENDANLWFSISDNYAPPQANAGSSKTVYTNEKVNFDGSASKASSGSTLAKYQWDFENDGKYDAEGEKTSYTYTKKGQYSVLLKVTDNLGETDTDTIIVNVLNRVPAVSFTYSPSKPTIRDSVNFVDTSKDQDGTIDSWNWDFGNGATSTSQSPTHQYADKGNYTVKLTVTDNDGGKNTTTKIVRIYNLAPIANFTISSTSPTVDQNIQFTDTSTDPEGKQLTYSWDFGDGYTSTVRNPAYKYGSVGTYTVKLTVTDDEGASHIMSKTLIIREKPPVEQPIVGIPLWILLAIVVALGAIIVFIGIVIVKSRKTAKQITP